MRMISQFFLAAALSAPLVGLLAAETGRLEPALPGCEAWIGARTCASLGTRALDPTPGVNREKKGDRLDRPAVEAAGRYFGPYLDFQRSWII